MKAWVLHGIGDLRHEDAEMPPLKPDEVLVEVKACGICGSDIPRIYQNGTYHFPTIPGHEFSGVVKEIGKEADSRLLGKRVGVFPLIPCMECGRCRRQHYEMCSHYSYLGSRTDGGFAEYAAVPQWNLAELPENVSFEQAAMLEPMAVAVHAMRGAFGSRRELTKQASIAVCGFGAVGALLTMFLLEAGCRNVLAVCNKDFQKETASGLGIPAENILDSRGQDTASWIMERTGGYGADIFFDCVGRNEVLTAGIKAAAAGGLVQLVGNPASDMALDKNVYWNILRRQLILRGSWNSSFTHSGDDDWHYCLKRLSDGRIHPERLITHRLGLTELEQGLHIMRSKTEPYGKVMAVRNKQ